LVIPSLDGWSWEHRADCLLTVPPEGKAAGYVRYTECLRPLVRAREAVRTLEEDRRFRVTSIGQPERLITNEGEYAAIVTVEGLLLELPVEHTIGLVFLDDYYARIDGLALRQDERTRMARGVRLLALNDAHGLGERRRRRFLYAPPTGWTGIASSLHAYWYPVDYPKNPSSVTIFPAVPVPPGSQGFGETVARSQAGRSPGFTIDSVGEPTALVTRRSLSGSRWEVLGQVDGQLRFRDLHVLDDRRFVYTVILESPRERRDENLLMLRALLDSVEPIPHPGEVLSAESRESMTHWAE
jgi:hypothetical protein